MPLVINKRPSVVKGHELAFGQTVLEDDWVWLVIRSKNANYRAAIRAIYPVVAGLVTERDVVDQCDYTVCLIQDMTVVV